MPDALSGLGAHEHPEGSLGVGALPEESLHLGERPEEDQVSVHGEQFPSRHQAGHLKTEPCFRHIGHLHRTEGFAGASSRVFKSKSAGKRSQIEQKNEEGSL